MCSMAVSSMRHRIVSVWTVAEESRSPSDAPPYSEQQRRLGRVCHYPAHGLEVPVVAEEGSPVLQCRGRDPHIVGRDGAPLDAQRRFPF